MWSPTKGVSVVVARWSLPAVVIAALLVAPPTGRTAGSPASLGSSPASSTQQRFDSLPAAPAHVSPRMGDVAAELGALDKRIAALRGLIPATQAQVASEREQLRAMARAIYVQPSSLLVMVAGSSTMADIVSRLAEASAVGARAHSVEVSLVADSLLLTSERSELQKAVDQRARAFAELVGLSSDEVWGQVSTWFRATPDLTFPASPGHSKKYRFIWPEPSATVAQPFGPTQAWMEPPYAGFAHFHTGIDLDEPCGSPVHAADDGVVIAAGHDGYGYGSYLILGHAGGLATLYGHLSSELVKVGDQVTQGQVIAREGSTGNSSGPHLHFEVRTDLTAHPGGIPVDPTAYLPPGPPSSFSG